MKSKKRTKASDFLVEFIKTNLAKEVLAKFLPLTEDSLYDLCEYIEINIECSLSEDESEGKIINQKLLDDSAKAGDEIRDNDYNFDFDDFNKRLN